jgi:dUTP pyrophosphatase
MADPTVPLHVLLAEDAKLPTYATPGAAGLDLFAKEAVVLEPLERKLVGTGLRLAIPPGFEGQVRPRSGLALRLGLGMVNSPGTIDADYRGEVGLILINLSTETIRLGAGERLAQLVICPVVRVTPVAVETLEATTRGEGGFGSTGTT